MTRKNDLLWTEWAISSVSVNLPSFAKSNGAMLSAATPKVYQHFVFLSKKGWGVVVSGILKIYHSQCPHKFMSSTLYVVMSHQSTIPLLSFNSLPTSSIPQVSYVLMWSQHWRMSKRQLQSLLLVHPATCRLVRSPRSIRSTHSFHRIIECMRL